MKKIIKHKSIAVTLITAMFFFGACKNDPAEVQQATEQLKLPLRVQYGVHYTYTDSAKTVIDIKAPQITDYSSEKEPYREFDKGLEVTFYDKKGNKDASLKSNYARNYEEGNMWEARGDVVVINDQGEQLNTEQLFWNRKEHQIYSDKFVTIMTDGNLLQGRGFEADENFKKWKIFKPTGEFDIDEQDSTKNDIE